MNREAIYSALFALVSAAPGFVTMSRKLRHWDDVGPSELPALFLTQTPQSPEVRTGQPNRWYLNAKLWIYVSTDGTATPGTVLNPLVDAIDTALSNFPIVQTLGGLVQWARIEGECETSEGTLGNREVVTIPIRMLVV